ncbi:GNAT family N-acetyltransferase [Streptomyces sp. NPDC007084]|uniref:GNAT family N-acetyltransferase n=1 Tax=Streptomyces sp. NPDC007084 TaxID=3154313 RepID=UPI00345644C7
MTEDRVNPERLMIRSVLVAEAGVVAGLHARVRAACCPGGVPGDGAERVAAWRGAIERPGGHVLCVVRGGRIAAVAAFRTAEDAPADTVTLHRFHVDPGHWRTGLGSALHAACVEQWQADGKRAALLDVPFGDPRARAFYARLGWVPDTADTADTERPAAGGDRPVPLRYAVPGRAGTTGVSGGAGE